MMRNLVILSLMLLSAGGLEAKSEGPLLGKSAASGNIAVNNRVVAKVNGKAISVIDLMKKMDLIFYREYPQYSAITEARYQFYESNWGPVLQELVDKELITADAEENKIPASAADVRQEMETLFGPNIINNLDKINMTFDEAWNIVQSDILIQRMLFIRVNSKALQTVTPFDVRQAYAEYAKNNINPSEWVYQVIAVRDKDPTRGAQAAHIAHQMLTEENVPLTELLNKIKEQGILDKETQLTVSEEFHHKDKEISAAYKEALEKISGSNYSSPIAQHSRANNSMAFRIFYLKEFNPGGAPAFNDVAANLKEQLLREAVNKETEAYLDRLHKHFDVQEMVPEGFQPFVMK